jgi:hypothetical protein
MADALSDQLEHPDRYGELEFTARLGLLVDREAQDRDNRRLTRNLKTARLRAQACVEDIEKPCSVTSRPARRSCTYRRSRGLPSIFACSGRVARWSRCHCATVARYVPPRALALRRSSRDTVDADRPRRRAISRTPNLSARQSAIRSRSANDRYRPEST